MEMLSVKVSNSVLLIMPIILKILNILSITIFLLPLHSLVVRKSSGQRITKLLLVLRELSSQDPSGSRIRQDFLKLNHVKCLA